MLLYMHAEFYVGQRRYMCTSIGLKEDTVDYSYTASYFLWVSEKLHFALSVKGIA